MSGPKWILLISSVACALSLIGSTSASAAECKHGGSTHGYCVAKELLTTTLPVLGTSGLALLRSKIGGALWEMHCASDHLTGTIEPGGMSTAKVLFLTCTLVKPAKCQLTAAQQKDIPTSLLLDELILTSGRIEDKFSAKSGTYVELEIEPKEEGCFFGSKGKPEKFPIAGADRCEADTSNKVAEEEKLTHELICKEAGSELKLGTETAKFSSTGSIMLENDKLWSIGEL